MRPRQHPPLQQDRGIISVPGQPKSKKRKTPGKGLTVPTSIRTETPTDVDAITCVHDRAFGQPNEGCLIKALRERDDFDPRLSIVAEDSGAIIGHILFTPIQIESEDESYDALALAPMAVIPERQRQGIGSLLITHGLDTCRTLDHSAVIVLGHEDYYPRFGFQRASRYGIKPPFEVPDKSFMVLPLTPNALAGVGGIVRYPPPCNAV